MVRTAEANVVVIITRYTTSIVRKNRCREAAWICRRRVLSDASDVRIWFWICMAERIPNIEESMKE